MSFGTTETGAQRQSIGTKIDTDLVPFELTVAAAVGLGLGEHKYAARNFEKGLSYRSLINSLERHCKALKDGEEFDKDTGIPHYMLIASSTAMLVHNVMQGKVIDDRAPPKEFTLDIGELAELGQKELTKAIAFWQEKQNANDN
ncbi:structural protein [Roseovarius sp. 217 phage 1]|uniref:Structural protein n=1 Tax=Roseovarius sp. 217 phage 1 TaxID=874471 RepID=E3PZ68_9CAUD|nr:structural protein [Roseovarius sp. 217 phage 1]